MPKITNDYLNESSGGGIQITIKDSDGDAVTPNAGVVWTLTDMSGTVINSQSDTAITESSTMVPPLTGDDLAIQGTAGDERRVLTIEGTYNDGTLGNNIPFKEEFIFIIKDLIAVS